MPVLLILPSAYLFVVPTLQLLLLQYCFGTSVGATTMGVVYLMAALFTLGYCGTLYRLSTHGTSRTGLELHPRAVTVIATTLLVFVITYTVVASYRIHLLWEVYVQGPAEARILLPLTRKGVTAIGFFNAFLFGVPVAYLLFVLLYVEKLMWPRLFKIAAVLSFAAFTFFFSAEGGRFAPVTAIIMVLFAILIKIVRGSSLKQIGRVWLFCLFALAAVVVVHSYRVFEQRDNVLGRKTVGDTHAAFSRSLEQQERTSPPLPTVSHPPPSPSAEPATAPPPAIGSPERSDQRVASSPNVQLPTSNRPPSRLASRGIIAACYYFCHSLNSIERIINKGADRNLYGFYSFPYFHKALQIAGLVSPGIEDYQRYYDTEGFYTGLTGTMLIDFGLLYGPVAMLVIGALFGWLVWVAIGPGPQSMAFLLTPFVPTMVLFGPFEGIMGSLLQVVIIWVSVALLMMLIFRLRGLWTVLDKNEP